MVYNTGMIKFKEIRYAGGQLTPVEGTHDIPFDIKRIYYISNVPNEVRRGFHSHKMLHQVLICVSGSVNILAKTPDREQVFKLSDSSEGLYIGPMIWREMFDFSNNAVLMVLASEYYDEKDYIRNYSEYEALARKIFR